MMLTMRMTLTRINVMVLTCRIVWRQQGGGDVSLQLELGCLSRFDTWEDLVDAERLLLRLLGDLEARREELRHVLLDHLGLEALVPRKQTCYNTKFFNEQIRKICDPN